MEHLFFVPEGNDPLEFKRAYLSSTLSANWSYYDRNTLLRHVAPLTSWLGFQHDQVPRADTFDGYPALSGWNVDAIWNGQLREAHPALELLPASIIAARVAAFLQACLYYCLVESIVGKKISVSYLMRPNEDSEELSYSRNLHFCLRIASHTWRLADEAGKRVVDAHIMNDLRVVHRWVSRLAAWSQEAIQARGEDLYPNFIDLISRILPAPVRLVEAIMETRMYALRSIITANLADWPIPADAIEIRRKQMRDAQWCDFQIRLLEETTNQSTLEWCVIQNIKQDPSGHDECTPLECIRNNVPEGTNPQCHRTPDCRCSPLMPNLHELEHIIGDDRIPLVSIVYTNGTPEVVVDAISKDNPENYIAISHVWVDGMGGLPVQGLLSCQLQWLNNIVAHAPSRLEPAKSSGLILYAPPERPRRFITKPWTIFATCTSAHRLHL